MTDSPPLLIDVRAEEGIACLTINRPEKRNALNAAVLAALARALDDLKSDPRIGAIVTGGAGEAAYCAGMDLYYLKELAATPRPWADPNPLVPVLEQLRSHPKITIAAVHGYCLGGGLALMNAHDLVVAEDSAQIGMPEILRGSFGQLATSTLYHTGVPLKKAMLMHLTGEHLSGPEAERLGLVSKTVPNGQAREAAMALARRIAAHNHAALEHAKIAAYWGGELGFSAALRFDELVGARMRLATDSFADIASFLASRKQAGEAPTT